MDIPATTTVNESLQIVVEEAGDRANEQKQVPVTGTTHHLGVDLI